MMEAGPPWGLLMNAMHGLNIGGEDMSRNDCNSNYRQATNQRFSNDAWRFMNKQDPSLASVHPDDMRGLFNSRLMQQQNGNCHLGQGDLKEGFSTSGNGPMPQSAGVNLPPAWMSLEALMQHQLRAGGQLQGQGGAVDEGRMRWMHMIQAYGIPLPGDERSPVHRGPSYQQPRTALDNGSVHTSLSSGGMSTADLQLKSSDSFSSSDMLSAYEDSLNGDKLGLCSRKLKAPSAAHLLYMQQKAEGTKWVTVWKLPGWVDKAWVEEGFSRFGEVQKVMLLDGRFGLKLAHIQFPTNDCVSRVVEADLFVADNQLEVVPGKVQRARWLEGKAADRQHRR